MGVRNARPITHQAAGGSEVAMLVDRRHGVACRQRGKLSGVAAEERIAANRERASRNSISFARLYRNQFRCWH